MVDEIILRIQRNNPVLECSIRSGKRVRIKNILSQTLLDQIIKSTDNECYSTGLLPINTVAYAYLPAYGSTRILLADPARTVDKVYQDMVYPGFPVPRFLWEFHIAATKRVEQVKLLVADDVIAPDAKLYLYPFSNVYSDNSICLGSNTLPPVNRLSDLWQIVSRINQMPDNNDLFNKSNNRLKKPYAKLLEYLKDKDSAYYYDKILVPENITLQYYLEANGYEKR